MTNILEYEIKSLTKKEVEFIRFLLAMGRRIKGGEISIVFHNGQPDDAFLKNLQFRFTGNSTNFEKDLQNFLGLLKLEDNTGA